MRLNTGHSSSSSFQKLHFYSFGGKPNKRLEWSSNFTTPADKLMTPDSEKAEPFEDAIEKKQNR